MICFASLISSEFKRVFICFWILLESYRLLSFILLLLPDWPLEKDDLSFEKFSCAYADCLLVFFMLYSSFWKSCWDGFAFLLLLCYEYSFGFTEFILLITMFYGLILICRFWFYSELSSSSDNWLKSTDSLISVSSLGVWIYAIYVVKT